MKIIRIFMYVCFALLFHIAFITMLEHTPVFWFTVYAIGVLAALVFLYHLYVYYTKKDDVTRKEKGKFGICASCIFASIFLPSLYISTVLF